MLISDPFKTKQKRKTIAKLNQLFDKKVGFEDKKGIVKLIKEKSKKSNGLINYIEIGVKYGSTFKYILDNTKDINLFAYGFDLFEDFKIQDDNTHFGDVANMNDMKNELNKLNHFNFKFFKGDSSTTIKNKLDKLDNCIVFIDGNHTYDGVKKDFEEIIKKISTDSYVIFDDYNWKDVNKYVNEIKNKYKIIEGSKRRYFTIQV